jgi:hypothetical protein
VQIGTFFNGQTVTMKGIIPPGAQAVLEVLGSSSDEHLMRKGRRGGLWMNVGEITIHNAPSLYLVMSTAKKLLTTPSSEATWGYQSLEKRIAFSGRIEPTERQEFMKQFLELKEKEHIYAALPGALKVKSASSGENMVTGRFFLPTNTKPGAYKVILLDAINVVKILHRSVGGNSGFRPLMNLAFQHGATGGIIAVIIAIVTGFAMGFFMMAADTEMGFYHMKKF